MKLVYFSWIREQLGMSEEEIELPGEVKTLGELFKWQRRRGEQFDVIFKQGKIVRVALDHEHVDDPQTEIASVKEIAFFPPMTGG